MIGISVAALVIGLWWLLATLAPRFRASRTRAMQFTGVAFVLFVGAAITAPKQSLADDGSFARASFSVECKNLIRAQLKAPDSARIPNYYDGDGFAESKTLMVWQGDFQAQNAFGVMLRSKFRCERDKKRN